MRITPNIERNRFNVAGSAILGLAYISFGSMPGYHFIYVFLLCYIAFNVSDIASIMLRERLDEK